MIPREMKCIKNFAHGWSYPYLTIGKIYVIIGEFYREHPENKLLVKSNDEGKGQWVYKSIFRG